MRILFCFNNTVAFFSTSSLLALLSTPPPPRNSLKVALTINTSYGKKTNPCVYFHIDLWIGMLITCFMMTHCLTIKHWILFFLGKRQYFLKTVKETIFIITILWKYHYTWIKVDCFKLKHHYCYLNSQHTWNFRRFFYQLIFVQLYVRWKQIKSGQVVYQDIK